MEPNCSQKKILELKFFKDENSGHKCSEKILELKNCQDFQFWSHRIFQKKSGAKFFTEKNSGAKFFKGKNFGAKYFVGKILDPNFSHRKNSGANKLARIQFWSQGIFQKKLWSQFFRSKKF